TVTVLLMCGRPGRAAVHTPQWCYGGAGYEMIDAEARCPVGPAGSAAGQLWAARFRKQDVYLRIFWGWSGDGSWVAPANPRLRLAHCRAVYKMYVIRELTTPHERLEDDACLDFLRQYLPELSRSLFPAGGPEAGRGPRGGPGPESAGTAWCHSLEPGERD